MLACFLLRLYDCRVEQLARNGLRMMPAFPSSCGFPRHPSSVSQAGRRHSHDCRRANRPLRRRDPQCQVTVSSHPKGFPRELVTNTAGEYTAAKAPTGDYVVSAEASRFQRLVLSGVTLAVGQILRVDLQTAGWAEQAGFGGRGQSPSRRNKDSCRLGFGRGNTDFSPGWRGSFEERLAGSTPIEYRDGAGEGEKCFGP
jgi:carboxypeptidase family protein